RIRAWPRSAINYSLIELGAVTNQAMAVDVGTRCGDTPAGCGLKSTPLKMANDFRRPLLAPTLEPLAGKPPNIGRYNPVRQITVDRHGLPLVGLPGLPNPSVDVPPEDGHASESQSRFPAPPS